MNAEQVARGLGWFSIGLGAVELAAPGRLTRFLGVQDQTTLVRAYGLREVLAGVGILAQPSALAFWVWSRVAGDVLDLGTLGMAQPENPNGRKRTANTLAALTAITVVDVLCARALSHPEPPPLKDRLLRRGNH